MSCCCSKSPVTGCQLIKQTLVPRLLISIQCAVKYPMYTGCWCPTGALRRGYSPGIIPGGGAG
ncbi:hypothetical protein E2C01_009879 [Portunus trituberculatus]|uniref:Uncharacterized protein n=1 Tax=Portunus trituberculatus TaxID=210409 RepID=A0A5B7D6Y8_PORTR|nr:hypothetical protein [Portunus trituberculatus]